MGRSGLVMDVLEKLVKKQIRSLIISAVLSFGGYFVLVLLVCLLLLSSSEDGKDGLAASATDPQRIAELVQLKSYGIPSDLVMIIISFQSETHEEALEKPFIFTAMEFMKITEIVKVMEHDHDDPGTDENGEPLSTDHDRCEYKYSHTVTYEHKAKIMQYLGIASEETSDLDSWNILAKAQAAAAANSAASSEDDTRDVQINAIPSEVYRPAVERCGITRDKDIDNLMELYEQGYFLKLLEAYAEEFGIDFDGSMMGGINNTHEHIVNLTAGDDSPFAGGGYVSPVPGNWRNCVTCEFGTGYVGHTGMDLGVPLGTEIYAVANGKVLYTSSASGNYGGYNAYGIHVVINHGGGIVTLYAHNSAALVTAGQTVRAGDPIALSGSTGNSTGPHLHLEFIVNGVPKNARSFLP